MHTTLTWRHVHWGVPGRALALRCLVWLTLVGLAPVGCAIRPHAVTPGEPARAADEAVRVWTERITLPTYAVRPDPVPRFQATDEVQFYPYPAQEDIDPQARPREWTVVCMENRYLKIVIMPELGGRVFAMYDKLAGQDVVYRQPSIKPAKAAIRGAWTSGGIEFNFPDSHSVTTHDRVHWTTREHADGSAAVLIGDIERISRMAWTVELRLWPDRACLQDRIVLHNRTPMRQRYYYWTNAGIEAGDQTQLIFPFPQVTGHYGGRSEGWPIRDGIDWSWYRRHTETTSLFAVGGQEGFIGAYDHARGVGVAQYADRHELPGRKFWSWGTSPAAQRWHEVLSDDRRPYLELQSGPLITQSDYAWMQPYELQQYEEYWIPVSRIGPFDRASPEAVVRLSVQDAAATVGVLPVRALPAARVELRAGPRVVQAWTADLAPEQPLLQTVPLDGADPADLRLVVRDSQGQVVVEHAFGRYALEGDVPDRSANRDARQADASTPAGAVRIYESQWLDTEYANAADTIEDALSKWPDDPQVRFAGGLFRLFQGRSAEAIDLLEPLAGRGDAMAVQANYYLGLAHLRAGDLDAASRLLAGVQKAEAAMDDADTWRRAATILHARGLLTAGRFGEAHAQLESIVEAEPDYSYAAALRAHAARRDGRPEAAQRALGRFAAKPDLEPMARLELRLLTGEKDPTLERMLQRDPEVAIELAADYASVGDWPTAEGILSGSYGPIVESGMTWFMAAWCAAMQGGQDRAAEYRSRAERAPVEFVLPSRLEELAAAENALEAQPDGRRAAYYAGLVLMRRMRYDEAIARWRQAVESNDDNPFAHRSLAMALARVKDDPRQAVEYLERAVQSGPRLPAFYLDLADLYEARGRHADARDVLERAMGNVEPTDALVMDLAGAHLATGQYREATQVLAGHRFNVAEGRYGVHDDYAVAWVGLGLQALRQDEPQEALSAFEKALDYPENMSIGRPADPQNESMIHFWRGVALQELGRAAEARQAFDESVRQASSDRALRRSFYGAANVVHGILALKALGRSDEVPAQIERLGTLRRRDRQWQQEFERFRSSMDFRTAWAQALEAEGWPTAAMLRPLADDPQLPAGWVRLSILASEVLERSPRLAAATQPVAVEP